MSNEDAIATLMADIGAHGGAIQLAIFVTTLAVLGLAGVMANRVFWMLEEARLLYSRASQQLEAAKSLTAPGAGGAAQRLAAAAASPRRKLPGRRVTSVLIGG
ncbi:MAG: hypothetical protein AB7P23_02820 [Amphiplicatus sp.]